MSKGEFNAVAQVNGGIDAMINLACKDKEALAKVQYMADKLTTILENQQVLKTPIVRNGKESTIGYFPEVWKEWKQHQKIFIITHIK